MHETISVDRSTKAAASIACKFSNYLAAESNRPMFLRGDCLGVMAQIPSSSIDCCMTSPPYWGQRSYDQEGIGVEESPGDYISKLVAVFDELRRILKPAGSLWLNLGDSYDQKCLAGIPWRVALHLVDTQKWILRNSIIWNKVKGGPDNSKDKLRNVHENLFHFVKGRNYHYDADAIRASPGKTKVRNGTVISATGVSGIRYKRQIELSTALSNDEKAAAMHALNEILADLQAERISDFRMIIRGQQRTTHSDSRTVSGRARELHEKGYYFLKYHPNGSKPGDVWDILPEDTQKRQTHYAAYPEDLCRMPILATCPADGVVIDPFCGTGTTMLVAYKLGRKSVGIDLSEKYIEYSQQRCC